MLGSEWSQVDSQVESKGPLGGVCRFPVPPFAPGRGTKLCLS